MKDLFTHLLHEAKSQKMDALILWSELSLFYQKLGFQSFGKEYRVIIDTVELVENTDYSGQFLPATENDLTSSDYDALLKLRSSQCTLTRTKEEFQKLLTIPFTDIFIRRQADNTISDYFIIGKGYDLIGVMHEWSFEKFDYALLAAKQALEAYQMENVMLLTPEHIDSQWLENFRNLDYHTEEHPMAMIYYLNQDDEVKNILNNCFIWGLDSI